MTSLHMKLVETAEIINLPVRESSTFTVAWALRVGAMKTRGLGIDKTKKLWDTEAKRVGGQARLLEAFKRFLREKPEKDGYTHPGLSVFLNQQRADHWLPVASTESSSEHPRTLAPEPARTMSVAALGEPFVVSYLDPATFHEDGYVTPKTGYAKEKLIERRHELKAAGIAGIRNKE